jgi:hypothetical protein
MAGKGEPDGSLRRVTAKPEPGSGRFRRATMNCILRCALAPVTLGRLGSPVPNLVIVMAGDNSIHEHLAKDRDYHLWVVHWGDDEEVAERYRSTCDRFLRRKGEKWALVRNLVDFADGTGDPPFSKYDYVIFPDDDILFPKGPADISRAFQLASEIGADIFQPTIANSYYSWKATRQDPQVLCRAVTCAEIMMPAFSSEILRLSVLPVLHTLSHVRVGWGLEPLTVRLGEALLGRPLRIFALDTVGIVHMRPVGRGASSYQLGQDEAFAIPQAAAHPMKELARFSTVAEALQYDFPSADETADRAALEKSFAAIRDARALQSLANGDTIRGFLLRRLLKRAGRGSRRP